MNALSLPADGPRMERSEIRGGTRRHATLLELGLGNAANTPRLRQWGTAKIFRFAPDPNQLHDSRRLVPLEGRIAIVTDAGRDAVDAAVPARTK